MSKHRTYREALDPVWSSTLLSVPSSRSPDQTVAQVLQGLHDAFRETVEEAQKVLDEHPFTEVIATEAARRAGRRGDARLVVDPDGRVYLEILYKTQKAAADPKAPRTWSTDLPSIKELRDEAQSLGIDPNPFGRSKTNLKKAIEAAKAPAPRRMVKTGVAVGPVTVLNPSKNPLADAAQAAEGVDLSSLPTK